MLAKFGTGVGLSKTLVAMVSNSLAATHAIINMFSIADQLLIMN